MKLQIVPCSIAEAKEFIRANHRHHRPPVGAKFAVAVSDSHGSIRGVATVGRPVARKLDNGWTLEVNRVATDGTRNACSMLYSACWRASRALGYRKLVTYILDTEPGTSLAAAGWKCIASVRGRSWDCKSRPRVDKHPTQGKLRFEITDPDTYTDKEGGE